MRMLEHETNAKEYEAQLTDHPSGRRYLLVAISVLTS